MPTKQSSLEQVYETLSVKYGKSVVEYFKRFSVENTQTRESFSVVARNKEYLKAIPKFTFNLDRDLHPGVRVMLENMKLKVSVQDLLELENGAYFEEGVVLVYMQLLKLMQLVTLDMHTMMSKMVDNNTQARKIMYMEINEIMQTGDKMSRKKLKGFFD